MKKTLVTLLYVLFLLYQNVDAQITITKVTEEAAKSTNEDIYDSTQNFVGNNVKQYVGQTLFLKGEEKDLQHYGYMGFFTTNGCGLYGEQSYNLNPYKPGGDYNMYSSYDELVGKYFTVLDVVAHPNVKFWKGMKETYKDLKILTGKESAKDKQSAMDVEKRLKKIKEDFFYDGKCFLVLEEKESKDIVYYEYNTRFNSFFDFPFIVVGYFEKQRQMIMGKKYIFADNLIREAKEITTHKPLTIYTGQVWVCSDLTIEDEHYDICPVVQNEARQKVTLPGDLKWHGDYIAGKIFSPDEVEHYKNKFGAGTFDSLLQQNIRVGMTKEMVLLSFGEPEIKRATKRNGKEMENWLYHDADVFFNKPDMVVQDILLKGATKEESSRFLALPEKKVADKPSKDFCTDREVWFYEKKSLNFIFCEGKLFWIDFSTKK